MSVSHDFEHDVDTVFEVLTDPQFLVDRSMALGELSADCDVEEDGEGWIIKLRREVQRDLPRVLAKVFDPVQTLEMTEKWQPDDDGWSGSWKIDIVGQPVVITATFELTPTSAGCRYTVNHRVKARIPLVGKQVEKYILGQTGDGARAELDYVRDSLE